MLILCGCGCGNLFEQESGPKKAWVRAECRVAHHARQQKERRAKERVEKKEAAKKLKTGPGFYPVKCPRCGDIYFMRFKTPPAVMPRILHPKRCDWTRRLNDDNSIYCSW